MTTERAYWSPRWYELDQSIEVDVVAEHDFYNVTPERTPAEFRLVFYHGDWNNRELYHRRVIRITSITHPELGPIKRVLAEDLSYEIERWNGKLVQVEAEETPGVVEMATRRRLPTGG